MLRSVGGETEGSILYMSFKMAAKQTQQTTGHPDSMYVSRWNQFEIIKTIISIHKTRV